MSSDSIDELFGLLRTQDEEEVNINHLGSQGVASSKIDENDAQESSSEDDYEEYFASSLSIDPSQRTRSTTFFLSQIPQSNIPNSSAIVESTYSLIEASRSTSSQWAPAVEDSQHLAQRTDREPFIGVHYMLVPDKGTADSEEITASHNNLIMMPPDTGISYNIKPGKNRGDLSVITMGANCSHLSVNGVSVKSGSTIWSGSQIKACGSTHAFIDRAWDLQLLRDISPNCEIKFGAAKGHGGFGFVREGWLDGVTKAFKFILTRDRKSADSCIEEYNRMKTMAKYSDLFVIVDLLFVTDYCAVIVEEFISHGSLYNIMQERAKLGKAFTVDEIRHVLRQLLQGLSLMRVEDMIHRDLKPDNILISDKSSLNVKIADLGLRKTGTNFSTPCGTSGYAAPEIFSGNQYTMMADVWSLGVVIFQMVERKIPSRTKTGVIFDDLKWEGREHVRALVESMLQIDPKARITPGKALGHKFFA